MFNSRVLGLLAGIFSVLTVLPPMLDNDPSGPPTTVGAVIIAASAIAALLALSGKVRWLATIIFLALGANAVAVLLSVPDLDTIAKLVIGASVVLDALAALALVRKR
jgi:hypothetical protein